MNPNSETIELRANKMKLEVLKRFWPTDIIDPMFLAHSTLFYIKLTQKFPVVYIRQLKKYKK